MPVPVASTLLERDFEVERLSERIEEAQDGRGALVALEGEAGIGKSTLLARAAEQARAAGMGVLAARCGEPEREFPYGVARQLFESALDAPAPAERDRLLAGAAALAAPALRFSEAGAPASSDPGAILHGLYWLSANLAATRPLLIAVDDAHWADAPSIAFVSYLARRVDELPILSVYTARPAEGQAAALPGARDHGLVREVLHPLPLSESATAELVRDVHGPAGLERLAAACHHATGGNPFLLRELLRALQSESVGDDARELDRIAALAPASISTSVLARLRRLGDDASELAVAVAVLGTSVDLRHAAALAELEPVAAGEAADALATAAILSPGRPLEFAHPIVRSTIYSDLPPTRRSGAHKRAARILEQDGPGSDAIGPHLLATEPAAEDWAVERLSDAAAHALERGAPDLACAYLERACAEPPSTSARPAVLCRLGSAEARAARPGAIEHLSEGLAAAPDDETRRAAVRELAFALTAAGRVREAGELLAPLIAEIGESDPETAMVIEADLFGAMQIDLATAAQARRWIDRHDGKLQGETKGERLLIACLALEEVLCGESAERAAELAELALAGGRLLSEQTPDSHPFSHAVIALMFADRLADAERYLDLAVADARRRGSVVGFAIAAGLRSHALFRSGRIPEAESDAWASFEAVRSISSAPFAVMTLGYLLDAMIERDDLASCERVLAETGSTGELPLTTMAHPLLRARGQLWLATGDGRRALQDLEELVQRDQRWGLVNPAAWSTQSSAAVAHARYGDGEMAQGLAREGLARARRWGASSTIAVALRAAAACEAGERIDLLRESVPVARRSPARCEQARSLAELGAALRRGGHRADAREALREALDIAHGCGARRLAATVREELVASGARPRRFALSGVESLTASERRVARMAAEGLANREIAQALFVTTRTVEMHLTHAYQKLDIGSREQLPEALGPPQPATAASDPA